MCCSRRRGKLTATEDDLRRAFGGLANGYALYLAGCPAYGIGSDYLDGAPIRQDYLETAIDWLSEGDIDAYMSKHQHDKDAKSLWNYFQKVIDWVKATFPDYRREMKHVHWGPLYNKVQQQEAGCQEAGESGRQAHGR